MTKQDIAEKLAEELGVPKAKAGRALDSVMESIIATLKAGTKVNISGFGIFVAIQKASRTARNPKTGESIQVPAKMVAKFKPSKGLKESLNS